MSILRYFAGILCSFCLMIILLITSVKAAAYWTPGYYEKEYAKYNITADVNMEMDDLLDMAKKIMTSLRGDRAGLHVEATVGGVQREFSNERETAHMVDVQGLFLAALMIRRICLTVAAICVIALFLLRSNVKKIPPKSICIDTGLFFALICMLAEVISMDFNKYFVMFRHIFFNNGLWILGPVTDLLINIMPEPFFMDTAARIALTYRISVLTLFLACSFYLRRQKK